MMKILRLLSRYRVVSFLVVTEIWSLLIWKIILPIFHISVTSGTDWFWLGECAPGLAAISLTCASDGCAGGYKLIKPILNWRFNPFYYYFAIVILSFFYLAAVGVSALQGGEIPSFYHLYNTTGYFGIFGFKFYGISMVPILTILYCFCEEIGWRGYLLNKLLRDYDIIHSSIIVGICMAIFHIAIMNLNILLNHPLIFGSYLIFSVLDSFVFSWLYINTERSLLIVSLLHALMDIYGAFAPNILSPLGQGENGCALFLRFLFFLPVYVSLFKNRRAVY